MIGISDFKEFRNRCDSLFIDKTYFIREFLSNDKPMVNFIQRPRRFSKSMNLSMLKYFLELGGNHRSLFEGLAVMSNEELVSRYFGRFPVILLDLKDVRTVGYENNNGGDDREWKAFLTSFWYVLRWIVAEHDECVKTLMPDHPFNWRNRLPALQKRLSEQESIRDKVEVAYFEMIIAGECDPVVTKKWDCVVSEIKDLKAELERLLSVPDENTLMCCLRDLIQALKEYYGERVVVLVDEYDAPLNSAYERNYLERASRFLGSFFGLAFNTSDNNVFKACFVGIAELKNSGFMSHFKENKYEVSSYNSKSYSTCFGFTVPEIESLDINSETLGNVLDLYQGYYFGIDDVQVLNPWSVVMWHLTKSLSGHWIATAATVALTNFLTGKCLILKTQLSLLLDGGDGFYMPTKKIDAQLEIINILVLTGYLTYRSRDGFVMIPNKEVGQYWNYYVRRLYEHEIKEPEDI